MKIDLKQLSPRDLEALTYTELLESAGCEVLVSTKSDTEELLLYFDGDSDYLRAMRAETALLVNAKNERPEDCAPQADALIELRQYLFNRCSGSTYRTGEGVGIYWNSPLRFSEPSLLDQFQRDCKEALTPRAPLSNYSEEMFRYFDYDALLTSAGFEILASCSTDDYQGTNFWLLRNAKGELFTLAFGYGSCTVCDPLQRAIEDFEDDDYVSRLEALTGLQAAMVEAAKPVEAEPETWEAPDDMWDAAIWKKFIAEAKAVLTR